MKRALRYVVVPAAAAMLTLPAMAAPASAHPVRVDLGELGYGYVNWNHNVVYACDTSADGLGIRTVLGNGNVVRDRNGARDGCGSRQVPRGVDKIKVCATQSLKPVICTGSRDVT